MSKYHSRKSNGNLFAIAFKNLRERVIKKEQRTNTKKYAKRIMSDNFTRGHRGKVQYCYRNISYFGGSNNIFAGCMLTKLTSAIRSNVSGAPAFPFFLLTHLTKDFRP